MTAAPPHGSFPRATTLSSRRLTLGRWWYALRAKWRHLRIGRWLTRVLGPQYRRSRDLLELDITYLCNLRCLNCNRSCTQAPEALHLAPARLRAWVDEWIARGLRWRRIRVLGGEPTLHPQFSEIIAELQRYRHWHPDCAVELVTNGHGDRVRKALAELPRTIWVENSHKAGPVQPEFGPFNLAPCDDAAYRHADYRNGCAIMRECGMGLTPLGYYPCAVAGGIDRVVDAGWGRPHLPDPDDDMLPVVAASCALCGRFRDGHYVPRNLRPPLFEARLSPSWIALYARWRDRRRNQAAR